MLRQRVITALLLVAVFLPALFHPEPWALAGLSLILITLAGWEWGRLMGGSPSVAIGLGLACMVCGLLTAWAVGPELHAPLWWLLVGAAAGAVVTALVGRLSLRGVMQRPVVMTLRRAD